MAKRITMRHSIMAQLHEKARRRLRLPHQKIGCLEWTGFCGKASYPVIYVAGRRYTLPELLQILRRDDHLPEGYRLTHTCGNRRCMEETHFVARKIDDVVREKLHQRPPGQKGFLGLQGEANPAAILTDRIVKEMRVRHLEGASIRKMAKDHGIAYSHAYAIVKRQIWAHI